MRLFGKHRPPKSFDFMNAAQYGLLRRMVEEWLRLTGHSCIWLGDGDALRVTAGEATDAVWGLTNVAQTCAQLPESDWPGIIQEHFHALLTLTQPDSEPPFDEVKSRLKIRITSLDSNIPEEVFTWPFDGLLIYLAEDFPKSTRSLKREVVEKWQVSPESLWDIALENVWNQDKVSVTEEDVPSAGKIIALQSESFFLTTHLFMVPRIFPNEPEHGWLAAIPNRHAFALFELDGRPVDAMMAFLMKLGRDLYKAGPGSISPFPFWIRHGKVIPLVLHKEDGSKVFSPPLELATLLGMRLRDSVSE